MPTTHTDCPECGQAPIGSGCYHICPNSDHYYSPEQEREDDVWYGADCYDGWGDPDLDVWEDIEYTGESDVPVELFTVTPSGVRDIDPDDIPF